MSDAAEHVLMAEDDRPVPIRYWWLKRIALAGVVMVLGLVALRLWWGYEAQRRLDAVIAEYRAAGQMVDAAEFDAVLDAVPDEDNAAILYEEAMGKIEPGTDSGLSFYDFYRDRSLLEKKSEVAEGLLSQNTKVIELMREAQSRQQIAWSNRLNDAPITGISMLKVKQQMVAQLLDLAAHYYMYKGEYGESLEIFCDMWIYSDAVANHPSLPAMQHGKVYQNMAIYPLEDLMMLVSSSDTPTEDHFVQQLRRFIRVAQNDAAYVLRTQNSYLGNRHKAKDYAGFNPYRSFLPNKFWRRLKGYTNVVEVVFRPVRQLKTTRDAVFLSKTISAKSQSTFQLAVDEINSHEVFQVPFLFHPLSNLGRRIPGLSNMQLAKKTLANFFDRLSLRRLVVAALAVKLFEIEKGKWPETLAELVPEYLTHVPLDPFGGIDEPFKCTVKDDLVYVYGIPPTNVHYGRIRHYVVAQRSERKFYLVGKPEK